MFSLTHPERPFVFEQGRRPIVGDATKAGNDQTKKASCNKETHLNPFNIANKIDIFDDVWSPPTNMPKHVTADFGKFDLQRPDRLRRICSRAPFEPSVEPSSTNKHVKTPAFTDETCLVRCQHCCSRDIVARQSANNSHRSSVASTGNRAAERTAD